jgi:uncharacterized protein
MNIHQENRHPHTIQAYSDTVVKINHQHYHHSLILSAETLLSWEAKKEHPITRETLEPLLALRPEIILIGSPVPINIDWALRCELNIECMSLGAASRTFNILLSESRHVVLGLLLG